MNIPKWLTDNIQFDWKSISILSVTAISTFYLFWPRYVLYPGQNVNEVWKVNRISGETEKCFHNSSVDRIVCQVAITQKEADRLEAEALNAEIQRRENIEQLSDAELLQLISQNAINNSKRLEKRLAAIDVSTLSEQDIDILAKKGLTDKQMEQLLAKSNAEATAKKEAEQQEFQKQLDAERKQAQLNKAYFEERYGK